MVRLFFVVPVYDPCLCGITAGSTLTTNFFPPSHSEFLRQHRTIPALRLKHRSGSCGTAAALPKCSIMSGCGTRHRASGAKAPRTLRPLPLLRFAVSATGGAHLCSIQYYLRFWLGICRTSLTVSALRIMRYCLKKKLSLGGQIYGIKPAWPEGEFYFYLVVLSGQQASSPTNTFHACGMIE